ncbi:MAG: DCC1-like thiol-disulfide oxidoreductase family protein [Pseudomonadota bacterium]
MTTRISDLPPALAQRLVGQAIVVIDGECVLCSANLQVTLRLDRQKRFKFATAQSAFGSELYEALGLSTDPYDTYLVISEGQVYSHSTAALVQLTRLGGVWRLMHIGWLIPRPLRDALYRLIARNRYRWFGRHDQCLMPSSELKDRFVTDLA